MTRLANIQVDFYSPATGLSIHYAAIPWCEHERIFNECYASKYGQSQSAERINERGGFGVKEAVRLGYDNPLVIWVAGKNYPKKDSDWTKLALQFSKDSFRYVVLTEDEYKSLDLFQRIKDSYDQL